MAIPLSGRLLGRRDGLILSFLLICTGVSRSATGDPPEITYRSNVTEVRMTFSAIDQNNHGVATLQATDFAVVDKDVIVRSFQSFTRTDWTKLDIAIIVDTSESVTPHFRQEMAETLKLVSQTAGVPEQNLSIISFKGSLPFVVCRADCRLSHATERLPDAGAGGLTPLFDAVVFASDSLAQHAAEKSQKILILFSDGEDTVSRNSLGDAANYALARDVQIYSIDVGNAAYHSQGAAALYNLAGATGGQYFPARDGAARALNVILFFVPPIRSPIDCRHMPPDFTPSGFFPLIT